MRGCTQIIERGKQESRENRTAAHNNRGVAHARMNEYNRAVAEFNKAIADYRKALGIDPSDQDARYHLKRLGEHN